MLCTCFWNAPCIKFFSFCLFKPEIKRMSVFKNYEPGEPTCRLYVKNIAKQVEEKVGAFIALDPLMCVCLVHWIWCLFWSFYLLLKTVICHQFCVIKCFLYIFCNAMWIPKSHITSALKIESIFIICLPGPEVHLREIHQPFVRSREKHVCKQQSKWILTFSLFGMACVSLHPILSSGAIFDSRNLSLSPESF